MVGQQILDLFILVRVQVPQPKNRIAVFAKMRSVATGSVGVRKCEALSQNSEIRLRRMKSAEMRVLGAFQSRSATA